MRCKVCKIQFDPKYFNQKTCFNSECVVTYNRLQREKDWKKEKKQRKEKLKSRSEHLNELQVIFNRYIRERDKNEPCISCSKPLKGKYDAGHYRSVGSSPELRFEENNVHGQCVYCNQHLHGNLIEYRKGLIDRVGLHVVEWLELNHEPKKYTLEEIKQLKEHYKNEIKSIQRTR